ncbi:MAG: TetR/AcrR family transcriptional regulator [Anaerolineae bacterium]|nr:TetR/AcrR family transcriptional regulator [Anaerolineae bacterium]
MIKGRTFRPLEARRERRIARRKTQIMNAAAILFSEKGYDGTTTKEIAATADMAEGTLYNYFSSKRDILLGIATEMNEALGGLLGNVEELKGREDIIDLVQRSFDLLVERLTFTRTVLMRVWIDDEVLREVVIEGVQRVSQQLQQFIAELITAGIFRPVDPALTARIIMGMFVTPMLPVLRGMDTLPTLEERQAIAEATVDLLLEGIRARPAPGV